MMRCRVSASGTVANIFVPWTSPPGFCRNLSSVWSFHTIFALLSAGEDTALRDSFVAAERRRPAACGKTPYFATATAGGPAISAAIGQPRLRGTKAR